MEMLVHNMVQTYYYHLGHRKSFNRKDSWKLRWSDRNPHLSSVLNWTAHGINHIVATVILLLYEQACTELTVYCIQIRHLYQVMKR